MTGTLERGRAAYTGAHWTEAVELLGRADSHAPLGPEDLDHLATAAYLAGADALSLEARTRAHHRHLERGDPVAAARSAFWLGFTIIDRPDQQSLASGWLSRAGRLLATCGDDCVERGFLLCAEAYQHLVRGGLDAAGGAFAEASRIGLAFHDGDLMALARHGEGRVLLRTGHAAEGLIALDDVMVSVIGGEVAPLVTGLVYCSVISACHELFDLRRAREWTGALASWCDANPDVVPFRGACLVRRSELLRLQGEWEAALMEAERACSHLNRPGQRHEIGAAFYALAEMQRLRGALEGAEVSYREAAHAGRSPQPGLALLRLARGDIEAAVHAVRHNLDETRRLPSRVHALRAAVEIFLAADQPAEARLAADELAATAADLAYPYLAAAAAAADGAVLLATGSERGAIARLREACTLWSELEARYEVARTSELLGLAYQATGDLDGAQLEFETAASLYERLGATSDAARIARAETAPAPAGHLLTGRELEVLRLVATGRSNRVIAADLTISEKTVARHISNIFNKLDIPSRAAATAYAYRHKLV